MWSEKDISFRCETIIRGCSFEYINIAFDIGVFKSFRNTSCVDNVWEIIVLFPLLCLFCLPFDMVPAVLYTHFELELYFGIFREKFQAIWSWFIAQSIKEHCWDIWISPGRRSQFEKFSRKQMHFSERNENQVKSFQQTSARWSVCVIVIVASIQRR